LAIRGEKGTTGLICPPIKGLALLRRSMRDPAIPFSFRGGSPDCGIIPDYALNTENH